MIRFQWKTLGMVAASCSLLFFEAGCASEGEFRGQTTFTSVNLGENNYRIIKTGATGKSFGFKFLGVIPITSPTYSVAKAELYRSVGNPLEGKAAALANQTEDRSALYLILFSIPRVTVTADVIEFVSRAERTSVDSCKVDPQSAGWKKEKDEPKKG